MFWCPFSNSASGWHCLLAPSTRSLIISVSVQTPLDFSQTFLLDTTPQQVKEMYRNASVIGDNRIVFNIAGNTYRLIVKFNYSYRIGYVRFIGTHTEYDRIDAEEV